ncbi:hypothetical protein DFH06DRAFT_427041 [Mycena polygramma]|nr:hypothetical protein DFH06DRAFT_427041 [Mycena polygramma]
MNQSDITPAQTPAGPQPEGDENESEDEYTPALPPEMMSSCKKLLVGPTRMPPFTPERETYHESDDSDHAVGPQPLPEGVGSEERDAVKEFLAKEETRRREVEEAAKPKTPKRDEWMLVPPSSSVLGNLDPTKLRPRQFSRTSAPSKTADNTLWTETPAERQLRLADEVSGKKRRVANAGDAVSAADELEARKRQRIDEELRPGRDVEEHTRQTRGSALVDLHARARRGDEKDQNRGIWDRDRDMALSGRLIDDAKRRKMLQEAKGLGDRFGTGKTGGFF